MQKSCTSEHILVELNKKWMLLILKHLELEKTLRFNAFLELIPITPKILNTRLRELEEQKIVERKEFSEVPPRVEYTLTQKGKDLVACFAQLDAWSQKYIH